jgi:site-specific recombinase XerD
MINLDEFAAYLLGQRLTPRTINEHLLNIQRFMDWVIWESYPDISTVRYNDLLGYIQQQKATGIAVATINLRLASISHYFEYLKQEGAVGKNPAKTIRVKGSIKTVIENPLSVDALQALYNQYMTLPVQATMIHQRNTVILGLLIYQGIHSGELQKMEVSHINTAEGTVYIPSTGKSNSRQLTLSPVQILPLHTYLQEVRPLLKPVADELIPGSVRNLVLRLVEQLQGINPLIKNALHIRSSVMLNWLKQHNKRQVQYMAGHKYISSTEKYAVQQMDTLTDELSKHHPFG